MLINENLMAMVVSNPGGLWADYHHKTKTSALVIKLPSTAIKAIDLGARVELHIALTDFEECYVALGVTVRDSSDSPLISITPASYINYLNGILHFAREGHTQVFLYNEMNHCILHGELLITAEFKAEILDVWSKIKQPYLMRDYMVEDLFIESIFNKLAPDIHTDGFYEITLLTEAISMGHLTKVLNMDYTDHGNLIYEMGTGVEGDIQEEQLVHSLRMLFGSNVFHSPWKVRDTQTKEFVDVFAILRISILPFPQKQCRYMSQVLIKLMKKDYQR